MGLAPPHTPTTVPGVANASADRSSASVPRQGPDVGKQPGFSVGVFDFFDFTCFMPFADFFLLLPFALSLLKAFFMLLLDLLLFGLDDAVFLVTEEGGVVRGEDVGLLLVATDEGDTNSASMEGGVAAVGEEVGFLLVAEEEGPGFVDFISFMPFTDCFLLLPFALSLPDLLLLGLDDAIFPATEEGGGARGEEVGLLLVAANE